MLMLLAALLARCHPVGELLGDLASGTANSPQAGFFGRAFQLLARLWWRFPACLFTREQVMRLVDDLEVRFLGNHDPNIYFALLTDLPDSPVPSSEDDPLIDYCGQLIGELNDKYAGQAEGSFLMFHRHRVYNPRERVWMGWERKRGKLMDLNKLLRNEHDSFPVKVGDLSVLSRESVL